ncbi:MAG: UDP-N-acetylmuramoyl-tripeptide--D-alanyl-D-alanine ligase [Deltaproteobacteria bacterium]|jgi:UDP-N-acetylmuramoyl-tripeptide--D-alanyl-D-alanine ligase|nr:UDP-N-acetylmuramoyl-tripeptide--D-alanyl-D-alanine ligase [Deltaproteobacteria bacterium]
MNTRQSLAWTLSEVLKATGGELLSGDPMQGFENIGIDSRDIRPQDVFVAIAGEVHDGHSFVKDVVAQGVSGLVVDRKKSADLPIADWQTRQIACVAVADTTRALGDLAAYHRSRTNVPLTAITGSNGKTTTRQMTAQVLAQKYKTLATIGNYNNQIGVPLTLLRLSAEYEQAVVELGTNSPGEIARLAQICAPDIAVVTNVGPAHLEGLGSLDGVMREKEQLIKHLKAGGKAALNADDRRVYQMARRTDRQVLLFGLSEDAAIRATELDEKTGGISFRLHLPDEHLTVSLNVPGQFMVLNALAAAAVGHLLKLSAGEIKAGLESFEPVWGRMDIFETASGIHIIDDTYNANPESMKAAVTTLRTLRRNSRSLFVAGDMLELGEQSEALHKQVGAWAAAANIDKLLLTGEFASAVAAGAMNAKMKPADIFSGTRDEIITTLKQSLKSGDWVLIKGSRGARMETIVKALKDWAGIRPKA